jgi:hypothetical protein
MAATSSQNPVLPKKRSTPRRLTAMGTAARAFARPHAADELADAVAALAQRRLAREKAQRGARQPG